MVFPGCNKFHYIYTMYTYNLGLFTDLGVNLRKPSVYKQAYLVKMVFTQMRTFLFSKL